MGISPKHLWVGLFFVMLLLGVASSALGQATVTTDKENYSPGETAVITGTGWTPGEVVSLLVYADTSSTARVELYATADESGGIRNEEFVIGAADADVSFFLEAVGHTSQQIAETSFFDGYYVVNVSAGTQSPNPIYSGQSTTYSVVVESRTIVREECHSHPFVPYHCHYYYECYSGFVCLSVTSSLPPGVTYGFNLTCTSAPGSPPCQRSSTLTIYTSPTTPVGNYSLTIKAACSNPNDYVQCTVNLNVGNLPPVANNDSYWTLEDHQLSEGSQMGLLINDVDSDGDSLIVIRYSDVSHGTVYLHHSGSFNYIPNANWNGTDQFSYRAWDGKAYSNVAVVTIEVRPVNDPPSALDDSYATNEDAWISIWAPGFLANDSDPDGDALSAVLSAGTQHGTLQLGGNGWFMYLPNANWHGTDQFTYRAWDGTDFSNLATVSIQVRSVNDPPVPAVDPLPVISGECPGPVTVPVPTANDDDDGVIAGTTSDPVTYTMPGTYTVHWSYKDSGRLTVTQNQTVEVADNTAPQLACPADRTFEQGQSIDFGEPTATDPCDAEVTITFTDVTTPGTCPVDHIIARTWTATDDSGNSSTCVQTVTVLCPGAAPVGDDVIAQPIDSTTGTSPITMEFDSVVVAGMTTLVTSGTGTPPTLGFKLGNPPTYYELATTAVFADSVTICINYSGISFGAESTLTLRHREDSHWVDCTVSLDTWSDVICGRVASLSSFVILEKLPPGAAAGHVVASCPAPDTPLYGVTIDAYEVGTGSLAGTAVTDAGGAYMIENLEAGYYSITVIRPLGYDAASDEIGATIAGGDTVVVDFPVVCLNITAQPRSMGFWKHQVGVATGGQGSAQIEAATLCGYLDLIETHFNSNAINQVAVYQPPASGNCPDKLEVAKVLLNLKGSAAMIDRAKQQLMALLLNVASQYIGLTQVVSDDGATLSQAITYCDRLIDDNDGANDERAKNIADMINNGITVPAGKIPLETPQIAYSVGSGKTDVPKASYLSRAYPNPFNPSTVIEFGLARACRVRLAVYNVVGQEIKTLVDEDKPAGNYSVPWNGEDNSGRRVPSGVYFCKIVAAHHVQSSKLVVLK